jgi:hypothetical protein
MEEYPKLLAIGWNPMPTNSSDTGTLIYLLEDEDLFYGYAQHPDFDPRVKPSHFDVGALRWCRGVVLPKGDEDVRKLYREALDIIENDNTKPYSLKRECLIEKKRVADVGKVYWFDLSEVTKKTLANPDISKYFL